MDDREQGAPEPVSLDRLAWSFAEAPVRLVSLDAAGRVLSANARWLDGLGYQAGDVIGHAFGEFLTASSRSDFKRFLSSLLREGRVSDTALRCLAKDGRIRDCLFSAVAEYDAVGSLERLLAVVTDVTGPNLAGGGVCDSEELFRVAFESANEGLCIVGLDGRFLRVNEALCRFLGRDEKALLDRGIYDLDSPDAEPVSPRHIALALAGVKEQFSFERRYRHASGREIWGRISCRLVRDPEGKPRYFVCHVLDVTETKRTAAQLRQHAESLEALLQLGRMRGATMEDLGAYVLDRAVLLTGSLAGLCALCETAEGVFRILAADPGALARLGLGAGVGSFPVSDAESLAEAWTSGAPVMAEALDQSQADHGLCPGPDQGGGRLLIVPIRENGLTGLVLLVCGKPEPYDEADVHRLSLLGDGVLSHRMDRRREEDLERAKRQAEAANQSKSGFLANMSHEIRTPLSGIIGLTQMALGLDPRPATRENLEMILDSSRSLLSIVNDILDFSKIEAGKMEFSPIDFELREALDRTLKPFQFSARQKGLRLATRIDPELPDGMHGDPDRLMQVVRNLVGNAIKFTDQGQVTVSLRLLRPGDPMLVECLVRDTGIGIPKERTGELFQIFSQLETSRSKRFGGTGLGLAISRRLVEMMGGTIGVTSEPGQGSAFAFTVSLRPATETPREPVQDAPGASQTSFGGLRVLLAEDNQVNRLFLNHFLVEAGCQVSLAGSGGEVLALLGQVTVDLVLMDIQMPEMDGIEATRRLRDGEAGEGCRRLPVVALTAYNMKGDRERFLAAGLDDYVSKPVDVDELFMVMRRVLDQPGRIRPPQAAVRGPEHVDMAYYEDRGKSAFAREICRMFLDECPAVVERLAQVLADGDTSGAGEVGHTLLGMAVPLRAVQLTDVARRLQEAGLAGDVEACRKAGEAVREELEVVREAVRRVLD